MPEADLIQLFVEIDLEQGVAEAQHNLGVCYANGEGVPQDEIHAVGMKKNRRSQPGTPVFFNWLVRTP